MRIGRVIEAEDEDDAYDCAEGELRRSSFKILDRNIREVADGRSDGLSRRASMMVGLRCDEFDEGHAVCPTGAQAP